MHSACLKQARIDFLFLRKDRRVENLFFLEARDFSRVRLHIHTINLFFLPRSCVPYMILQHMIPHDEATVEGKILAFCSVPRSRDDFLKNEYKKVEMYFYTST